MSDDLLKAMLEKPVGPVIRRRPTNSERDFTRQVEVKGEAATVTVRGSEKETTEDIAAAQLWAEGLDPAEWAVTGYRTSEWTMPSGEKGVSRRFTYAYAPAPEKPELPNLDELIERVSQARPVIEPAEGDHGFLILLGDMQFGKIDGDGVEGTLARTIACLDRAAVRLMQYGEHFPIGHVHLGWLGDHVEGFVSQGGANIWRTPLTLSEQIRLTRRVMLYALELFAPLAARVSMAAVPGNHGETVRPAGKGVTRYDDSHDTESLIAVADAARLNPQAFGHVEFYVPQTDEMTVVLDVAGTVVAHAHGHQWKPGKHWDWWRGQAFAQDSAMHRADLLVAGHLHHERIEADGPRTFIQVPAMESESTWWRHRTGTGGAPGLIVAVTREGKTNIKEVVRSG